MHVFTQVYIGIHTRTHTHTHTKPPWDKFRVAIKSENRKTCITNVNGLAVLHYNTGKLIVSLFPSFMWSYACVCVCVYVLLLWVSIVHQEYWDLRSQKRVVLEIGCKPRTAWSQSHLAGLSPKWHHINPGEMWHLSSQETWKQQFPWNWKCVCVCVFQEM